MRSARRLNSLRAALSSVAAASAFAAAAAPGAHAAAGFGCGGVHNTGDLQIGYCISTDASGVHVGGVRLGVSPGVQGGFFGHAQLTYGGYAWQAGSRHLANGPDDFLGQGTTANTRPVAYWLPGVYCVTWWHALLGTKPQQYRAEPGYCRFVS